MFKLMGKKIKEFFAQENCLPGPMQAGRSFISNKDGRYEGKTTLLSQAHYSDKSTSIFTSFEVENSVSSKFTFHSKQI